MTTYLSQFKAIGFDFDNTIASINSLHNKAWELVLSNLNISITKNDFFIWPVSPYDKFENRENIANCLFNNKNIKDKPGNIYKKLSKLAHEKLIYCDQILNNADAAKIACSLKDIYLVEIINNLSPEQLKKLIAHKLIDFLYKLKTENPNLITFIASSTNTEVIILILRLIDLSDMFDVIIGDENFKDDMYIYEKSSKNASKIALNILQNKVSGLKGENILYIGDDELRDYEFINNICGKFILIYKQPRMQKEVLFIKSFDELENLLFSNIKDYSSSNFYSQPLDAKEIINHDFQISISLQEQQRNRIALNLTNLNIVSLHADFSDGSQLESWRADCLDAIKYWSKRDFKFPLEIHIYSLEGSYIRSTLKTLTSLYPNIKQCFLHVRNLGDIGSILEVFKNNNYSFPINLSISYSTDMKDVKEVLKMIGGNINELLILLPKKEHNDVKFTLIAIPQIVEILNIEGMKNINICVDRDIDPYRVSTLTKLGIRKYVIGKYLYSHTNLSGAIDELIKISQYVSR